jgi:hypothetical protein
MASLFDPIRVGGRSTAAIRTSTVNEIASLRLPRATRCQPSTNGASLRKLADC